jgi:hypothetical protein
MFEFDVLTRGEKLFGGVVMAIFGFVLWVIDVIDAPPHMKAVISIFPIFGIVVVTYLLIRSDYIYYYKKGK